MRRTFILLACLLKATAYRPHIVHQHGETPDYLDIEFALRPRWYLPFYWLWWLVQLPLFFLLGGLLGVGRWGSGIWEEFREEPWRNRSGDWKTKNRWLRKRAMLQILYWNR